MAANVFDALPVQVQRRIDRAFVSAGEKAVGSGFIRDEGLDGGTPTQISMADVPSALQKLDLPPDDDQVLAVFRNAASGWSAPSSDHVDPTGGGWVSRDDWRAVCAVLLEQHTEDDSDAAPMQQESDMDAGSDDQYFRSEGDDEDSDDEYIEGPSTSTARRRTRGRTAAKSSPASPSPASSSKSKLTKRQQEATLEAFALFFPEVAPEDIPKQKIMIKDIQRVAKLLAEKIKADEMVEMLDAFSTSPDKSVGLEDFGRIMVAARLA
ncbi:hypothetical protein D9615_006152 [Tricholomella constricta]|uniref:Uncharacterized protein n=1 Tax=Tricholomella constricta TaxID=117010 RepID=A0A8H5HB87_9AGAR|nr:hypothetical protein D9615_006152 [Tricholomella constricta]